MVTADGVNWDAKADKLVGSVKTKKSREVHTPAISGEYPVLVEQSGSYRVFTYSSKIASL